MVRMMPTVPLMAPPNERQNTACANDVANATPRHDTAVPSRPTSRTNLRPPHLASATLPQGMAVANWAAVKAPWRMPAWVATSESVKFSSKDLS